ncbi:ABC transporter G family member 20-like isoform X2 [Daktulosphaira vitifoliae]|uniref:ABC transporter G family member 20-like isoform X2 n=1 Tax=Daktulosphaira vitifoliae TaxID=58002 RepID=UPI0021AB07F2|nr:ABC transporter G family member 20-like isoform X2 [Daktulosphaira vitifoliae]
MQLLELQFDSSCSEFSTSDKIKVLLKKYFLKIWKNIGWLIFVFALPSMQVVLFFLTFGSEVKNLHLAVVNKEMEWETKDCPVYSNCTFKKFSCRFLNKLPKDTIIIDFYKDIGSAIDAVRNGNAWSALYFSDNFTEALVARMALGRITDDETLEQSEIKSWCDMSNKQIGLMLNRNLLLAYQDFGQEILKSCDENPKLANIPIQFNEPVYGKADANFSNYVAPGVILAIVFFLAVALTSSELMTDKTELLLDGVYMAGVGPFEIFLCQTIIHLIIVFIQTALVLIFMLIVFHIECKGNLSFIFLLAFLQGISGIFFGLIISEASKIKKDASHIAIGCFYPILLLSGILWPIESMPEMLQNVSYLLPLTMSTVSMRNMCLKGWNILQVEVYFGFISTIFWIISFWHISMYIKKLKPSMTTTTHSIPCNNTPKEILINQKRKLEN